MAVRGRLWNIENEPLQELAGDGEMMFARRWIIEDFGERWKNTDRLDIGTLRLNLGHAVFEVRLDRSSTADDAKLEFWAKRVDDGLSVVSVRFDVADVQKQQFHRSLPPKYSYPLFAYGSTIWYT